MISIGVHAYDIYWCTVY